MTDSLARPLILTLALLMAFVDLVTLLPGNPDWSSARDCAAAVAIQALIVWRLWHRSGFAWFFGVSISVLYLVALVLYQPTWGTEIPLAVTFLLTATQVVLLCTPPVLAFVWGKDTSVAPMKPPRDLRL